MRRRGHLRPQSEGRVGEVEGAAQAGGGEVGVQRRRRPAVREAELRRLPSLFGKFAEKGTRTKSVILAASPIDIDKVHHLSSMQPLNLAAQSPRQLNQP